MVDVQRRFEVDEAKLTRPLIRPTSVKKSQIIARLVASSTPIATIVGPAGYGKTTLLSRWIEDDPRPFAWVSVDERDNDDLVFLRDIVTAVDGVEPMTQIVFDALTGPRDSIWTRVPRVGNALAMLRRPIVVALDDLHAITNPSCLKVLAALVDYMPPSSQIAVTSRHEPDLPLARWRARGMLLEIGAGDLRLDPHEADLLLKGANVTLSMPDVAELTEQTEGWPAGLYLAALSIRSGAPGLAHNKGFSGDDRYVSEYFRLEVMSRFPKRVARFVMRSAVLETMTGPMCDAVLGTTGSARMLESLERSNSFVVALDDRGERFRYHHLFRRLLLTELGRSDPEEVSILNRRAMIWHAAHDLPEVAVRFGQVANATDAVAELVVRIALPLYYDGRLDTLDAMLEWFRDEDLAKFPGIAVFAGWVQALTGHNAEAERFVAIAENATSVIPLADGSPTIEPWVAILRGSLMRDGPEAALADAVIAISQLAPGSMWLSDAMLLRGLATFLLGSIESARTDLLTAVEVAQASFAPDSAFTAYAELALLEARRGSWRNAADHADAARKVVERGHLEHYSLAALAHVAVARVAIQRIQHAEARAAMTRAHRLRPLMDHGLPWLTVQVGVELTRSHLALGELDAARSVLADTLAVIERRPHLGILVDEAREMQDRIRAASGEGSWGVSLTAAELRLLPYLATYLTFPEIAAMLYITSHTVRSEAKAIYRKLDATSRAEAIDRAVDVGLLEPTFPHRQVALS